MKKTQLLLIALLAFQFVSFAELNVIPRPVSVNEGTGQFRLSGDLSVLSDRQCMPEAEYLQDILQKAFAKKIDIRKNGKGIRLSIVPEIKEQTGDEGYIFNSTTEGITIKAASRTGIFYGIQTLRQLLPVNFEMGAVAANVVAIPVVEITDQPRFSWRAFMLDESRYFKGMEQVKKLLDQMALLKMNVFHWHLTDDQGWRIEIKKYPRLTEVGGFRSDSQVPTWNSEKRSGEAHGGFYTQAQIKEIIDYAAQRHIRIVPEIEMPGHASAAIAAYPWLGTVGKLTEVPVVFGKMEDSFNVADPRVYDFLKDVLNEVFQLFPDPVVHIGGDEVNFDPWKNSSAIQEMMKKEGLETPADLQIFFTNNISNFIDKSGKRMMGWNEILGGNVHEWQKAEDVQVKQKLASSAIIHFWKGSLDLINEAVSGGYDIVNALHERTYLDYGYKTIPVSKAYSFDPIPDGLDKKYHSKILGLGCQMWGEWIPTVQHMDKMVFPRLAAYAEVGWTLPENKNFDRFSVSLSKLKEQWKQQGIGFSDVSE